MELLSKLGIDWRLLIAQLINFLILLFVLYKFLYKPVLKMLQDRTTRIENSLADAQRIEKEIKQIEEDRLNKMAEARKESQRIIEEAKGQAEKVKHELLANAQKESLEIVEAGKQQLKNQQETLMKEARKSIAALVVEAARQVLGDVVDEKIDKAINEATIKKFS
ncbi:MAG: F0F1 ATP synthase subunit B [bacterium]|nr:F0F1 ATP synthase subunit B [bacterium]